MGMSSKGDTERIGNLERALNVKPGDSILHLLGGMGAAFGNAIGPAAGLGGLFGASQEELARQQQGMMGSAAFQQQFQNARAGIDPDILRRMAAQVDNVHVPSPIEQLEAALLRSSYEAWIMTGNGQTYQEWRHAETV